MMLGMKQVQNTLILALLAISLTVFLLFTNPEKLPLPLLLIPFILLASLLYVLSNFVISFIFSDMKQRRVRLISVVVATLPTLLLILASIKQLSVRDTAIIVALLVVLTLYMKRIDVSD
jgi:hypothetical protein